MNINDKRNKITSISDEVHEFHPILNSLFSKLPQISHVEYTHGSSEMGSDFILTKHDTTLDVDQYVGVIVKITQIGQNFDDVERQINECLIPKKINNGKNKVFLSEIWIVTSKNITENAQIKINHNYRDKKIVFIDRDKVIELIDKHMPDFWSTNIPLISEYFKVFSEKIITDDKRHEIITTNEYFYIDQDIEIFKDLGSSNYLKPKKRKKINIFDEVIKNKISIIEGGVGFGKSKLLRHIALHYAKEEVYASTNIIPIFTTMKELIYDKNSDINLLIDETHIKTTYNEQPHYLFLIDSLDETFYISKSNSDWIECIDKFLKYDNVHVVFTTRHFPLSEISEHLQTNILCYSLSPISMDNIITFFYKFCITADVSIRIIEDIKKSLLLKDIPKSPIAILLLAKILSEYNSADLPSTLTELYSKYMELMLGRWDIGISLQNEKEYLIINKLVVELAHTISSNNSYFLSLNECKLILEKYLSERNPLISIDVNRLIDKILSDSDIFYVDGNNNISFKHRSFLEFFVAKYYKETNSLQINNNIYLMLWSNIYYFYIGLSSDCPQILNDISLLSPRNEEERWGQLMFTGSYLLAAFMTPYEFVLKIIPNIFISAAKLYSDIITNNIDSYFNKVPKFLLLYFFQALMRMNYSYTFFTKSIEHTCLIISDAKETDEIKIRSLFMLGVVAYDLKNTDVFDFLIQKYNKILPLDIRLAIANITAENHSTTRALKSNLKILKSVSKTHTYKEAMKQLYSKPIDSKS